MPAKAVPPATAAVSNWTGFYAGVHGGFGGDTFAYPFRSPLLGVAGEASLNSSGFFGGGQVGYNFQFGSLVAGIEADIAASAIEGKLKASLGGPLPLTLSAGSTLDWFGTVRGRLGFLVTPNALLYATGGWAFGETTSAFTVGGLLAASSSTTKSKSGWTAGGGLEYAFTDWLSFKTEYLYLDLGSDRILSVGGGLLTLDEHTTAHTVKAGLNLKLGAPWRAGDAFAMAGGVPSATAVNWTGFSIGAHGGFGGDTFTYPFRSPLLGVAGEASLNSSGFFGGGQVGYDHQFGSLVAGIEADIAASAIEGKLKASLGGPLPLTLSAGSTLDWFGTVRGRLGYLVTPNALLYGTGGWAFGETTSAFTVGGLLAASSSTTKSKSGWTAGGGLEYALTNWLTFKTEYLYLDLGTDRILSVGGGLLTLDETTTAHTVKVGLNLKLGSL